MTATSFVNARRKIFVLSDWHLGGEKDDIPNQRIGSQICRSAAHITRFIDWVGVESESFPGITEIVINGDMVDFLAPNSEDSPKEWVSDEDDVICRLNRIIGRSQGTAGRGPFEALRDFLNRLSTELTINLGNHDIELSLPRVRQHLAGILGHSSRFRMIYDGEAIVRGRLLIEHGNRYDSWNAVSFNGLREERSHISRGLSVADSDRATRFFKPPAGTLMVVYAINTVLAEAPFINLLKPENQAAIPLLIAIEPNLKQVLSNILSLAPIIPRKSGSRLLTAAVPANRDNLTGDHGTAGPIDGLEKLLRPMLGADAGLFLNPPESPLGVAQMAQDTFTWIKQRAEQIAATLKERLNLIKLIKDGARLKLLEIAFRQLRDDASFKQNQEKAEYRDAAEAMLMTGKFDVVVFGHTHLQKRVEIQREGLAPGSYLNTGTWADVIKLPEALLLGGNGVVPALEQFFNDVTAKKLHGYLFTSLGYAEIELNGEQIKVVELRSFTEANPRAVPLTPFA